MVGVVELWLPVLVSAALVFVVSGLVHMALGLHKNDYRKLPGEDAIRAAIGAQSVPPGQYMFPSANSMKEARTPEMIEKFNQGPVGIMTMLPNGVPSLGKGLFMWFIFSVVVSIFAGYVGTFALERGAEYNTVFRVTGTVAILGYAFSQAHDSIWKGQRWSITMRFVLDGVVYGLVTGGVFGWLWP